MNLEKIQRNRIYQDLFYKEHCFGKNCAGLLDLMINFPVDFIGTTFQNGKPTMFLCCLFKLFHVEPSWEMILAMLSNPKHKYIRVMAMFYIRLGGKKADKWQFQAKDIFWLLEPFLMDYSKILMRTIDTGDFILTTVDQIVWELLTKESFGTLQLPILPKRETLVAQGWLDERISHLAMMIPEEEMKELLQQELKEEEDQDLLQKDFTLKFQRKVEKNEHGNHQQEISLDVDETNRLRKSLGMAPLEI